MYGTCGMYGTCRWNFTDVQNFQNWIPQRSYFKWHLNRSTRTAKHSDTTRVLSVWTVQTQYCCHKDGHGYCAQDSGFIVARRACIHSSFSRRDWTIPGVLTATSQASRSFVFSQQARDDRFQAPPHWRVKLLHMLCCLVCAYTTRSGSRCVKSSVISDSAMSGKALSFETLCDGHHTPPQAHDSLKMQNRVTDFI